MTNAIIRLFIGLVAIKAAYSLFHIITTSAPDFAFYYQASQEFTQRIAQSVHLLPPFSVLLYVPLGYLPYGVSQGIWVVTSFLLLIAIVWMMGRLVGITRTQTLFLITALSYVSFPTRFTLGMGQVNLIALALVVGAMLFERQKRSELAGVLLAVSWLLKPELVLLFPLLLFCRRWQSALAALLTISVAVAASLFVWGSDAYGAYWARVLPLLSGMKDAGIYYNQSLMGLLVRAGAESLWMYAGVILVVLTLTFYSIWKKPRALAESIWGYFPALILVEPIAWQHHLVFLLPTYIVLWARHTSLRFRFVLAVSYVLVSWNFRIPSFLDTMPLGWLVASHGTIGVLILWLTTL